MVNYLKVLYGSYTLDSCSQIVLYTLENMWATNAVIICIVFRRLANPNFAATFSRITTEIIAALYEYKTGINVSQQHGRNEFRLHTKYSALTNHSS